MLEVSTLKPHELQMSSEACFQYNTVEPRAIRTPIVWVQTTEGGSKLPTFEHERPCTDRISHEFVLAHLRGYFHVDRGREGQREHIEKGRVGLCQMNSQGLRVQHFEP